MALTGYKTKDAVVVVFTGDGKGKTSASLGLMARGLGAGWQVAYIQFIKKWQVNEHHFIEKIRPVFGNQLMFYQSGAGFYKAGDLSAKNVSTVEHKKHALSAYKKALQSAVNGKYNLVICDEINNAVHDGLLSTGQLSDLIKNRSLKTNLCLTGRNFPPELLPLVDIATGMTKIKHHFDEKFAANDGIDY